MTGGFKDRRPTISRHRNKQYEQRDLNSHRILGRGPCLPLHHARELPLLVRPAGLEPAIKGLKIPCVIIALREHDLSQLLVDLLISDIATDIRARPYGSSAFSIVFGRYRPTHGAARVAVAKRGKCPVLPSRRFSAEISQCLFFMVRPAE